MSLQTRLASLITSIGADVKSLQTQINVANSGMLPTSVKRCNMDPTLLANTVTSLVSGRLTLVRCPVKAGETYNGISFFSVAQATVPLNQVFALYNPNLTLIGTTPSDGTTAWAANTRKRLVLSSSYTPSADGYVYVGIAVTATAVPTLGGIATALQATGLAPIMHGSSNTGVSTPGTFPSTASALTALAGVPTVMLD